MTTHRALLLLATIVGACGLSMVSYALGYRNALRFSEEWIKSPEFRAELERRYFAALGEEPSL